MEDQSLWSMCKDPASYCSLVEQKNAIKQCKTPQQTISCDFNTYVHMVIPIHRHWIAVKVTILPFSVDQFPGQTFFSSKLRYGPCCHQINNESTWKTVRDTVQKVINSYYRPVSWDYSSSECCILDPLPNTNTKTKGCLLVAKSRFQAYARTAQTSLAQDRSTAVLSSTCSQLITTESSLSQLPHNGSLLNPTHSTSTEAVPSQGYPIDNHNTLNNGSCPTCGALQSSTASHKRRHEAGPMPRSKRISEEDITGWLIEGIANLHSDSFPEELNALCGILTSLPKEEANTCATYLWQWSTKLETTLTSVIWFIRFLSACCSLVGTVASEPNSEPIKCSRQTIRNWIGLVEIVNSIVNEILPSWQNEAYLLYHVFAAKGSMLSKISRVSDIKRKTFVSGVVDKLKKIPVPSRIEGMSLFNPTRILGGLLLGKSHEDICEAIGLPLAKTSVIEGERSIPQLPDVANLCLQLKMDLERNPTPPALQQESTIEANTDEANQYHQRLRVAPAETDHSRDSITVLQSAESSATITDLGTGSAAPHLTCSAGSLMLVEATGLLEGPGATDSTVEAREGASGHELRTGLSNNTGNISYCQ